MVYDVNTGKTLFSRHADAPRYPASLTKIMTLYIVFQELKAGRLKLDSRLKVSQYAAARPPSKLGLRPGSTISVKSAILSLVTKSANDVAAVVAENISGSEAKFAERMTRTARRLGMKSTTFRNPHGLPNSKQRTTARDMIRLGVAVQQHFPSYYRYFNTRSFKYGSRAYGNHNKLLGRVKGVDGIKTGYTRASGFNLVSNVKTGGRHIVAVVMGGRTGKTRDAHMQQLIARHLPKASRSGKAPLIASLPPEAIPVPIAKPGGVIAVASLASGQTAPTNLAFAPQPTVTRSFAPSSTSARALAEDPGSRPAGWLIQIGAMPSKDMAVALIGIARQKASSTLEGTKPFTETVEKGGLTLHRARFAGFDNKASARRACTILKNKNFACLALPPQ